MYHSFDHCTTLSTSKTLLDLQNQYTTTTHSFSLKAHLLQKQSKTFDINVWHLPIIFQWWDTPLTLWVSAIAKVYTSLALERFSHAISNLPFSHTAKAVCVYISSKLSQLTMSSYVQLHYINMWYLSAFPNSFQAQICPLPDIFPPPLPTSIPSPYLLALSNYLCITLRTHSQS